MRIKDNIPLDYLIDHGFHYETNLIFPTFKKVITAENKVVVIEILIKNKMVYINKSPKIGSKNIRFVNSLIKAGIIEK